MTVTIRLTKCSRIEAQSTMKRLLGKINRNVLGSKYRRYEKKLIVVPVLEGREYLDLHYHLLIENPSETAKIPLNVAIWSAWNNERKAPRHFLQNETPFIEEIDRGGWLRYVTKLRDKENFQDAIDITNLHIQKNLRVGDHQ